MGMLAPGYCTLSNSVHGVVKNILNLPSTTSSLPSPPVMVPGKPLSDDIENKHWSVLSLGTVSTKLGQVPPQMM